MIYRIGADTILLLHLTFTLFTVLGGLLVLRRPSLLWVHLAAVLWGVVIEWADWICPLTPLENALRVQGGEAGYAGGFIDHYVSLLLYPENLTIELRYLLGLGLVFINLTIYGYIFLTRRHRKTL
ncbi:DUF2784 domain-containing protein [Thiovibrio frasassiensis]|uniref:DUF2784 domain-containing protein n=1 Tax=Thiovibrio frasassiensis TaxID=2984131 RepID=A0A9X4RMH2_9BACT|nr:DUF2784 domain-containing protein [Thiovibrio frasassiensis]MDG4476360.1 DUF2784 domain-containing protein [Thiovibrio frasassiensis]